jgi:hypothetical protein
LLDKRNTKEPCLSQIAGQTEHERTLSQSERAQKELVEIELITCDANLSRAALRKQTCLGVNTDKPKPRIKYLWEPQEYETDEIANMFDTSEGIRTLREFAINGI